MSVVRKNAKSLHKTSGSSARMPRMVCGKWSRSRCTVYLGQSAKMCRTLRCTLQGAHTGSGFPDRRWPRARREWPTRSRVTTTSSWWTRRLEDLHVCTTGFTSHSLLSCRQSQSLCHLAKTDWWRAVLKSMFVTPGTRVPWRVASLAAASAASLPVIPTWPGIQDEVMLKLHLKSEWQLMHSSSISGCVRLGDCRPRIALRKSVHSRNCPGLVAHSLERPPQSKKLCTEYRDKRIESKFEGLRILDKCTPHWSIHQRPICEKNCVPWVVWERFWKVCNRYLERYTPWGGHIRGYHKAVWLCPRVVCWGFWGGWWRVWSYEVPPRAPCIWCLPGDRLWYLVQIFFVERVNVLPHKMGVSWEHSVLRHCCPQYSSSLTDNQSFELNHLCLGRGIKSGE
jgi:hypothetical protein